MTIIAIVQARMNSSRLYGKVMREVAGKPLIGYLLERLACARELDGVIVAMPKNDAGSTLADYVNSLGVAFYAGQEENDVAARFLAVLDEIQPDAFVRVCADSPLIDPRLVDELVRDFRAVENAGFMSNVGNSLLPPGQHAEIVKTEFYRKSAVNFTAAQREHAGFPWFYSRVQSLAVDTEADFQRISRVIEQMTAHHTQYDVIECMKLCRLQ